MGICFNEAGIFTRGVEWLKKEHFFPKTAPLPPFRSGNKLQGCSADSEVRVSQCWSCQCVTHRYQLQLQDPGITQRECDGQSSARPTPIPLPIQEKAAHLMLMELFK